MAGNTFKTLTNNRSNPSKKTTTTKEVVGGKYNSNSNNLSGKEGGILNTWRNIINNTAARGKAYNQQMQQPISGGGYGGGYGALGGGGYGGGSSGPTKEMKAAGKALGGLAAAQAQAAQDKFNNVKDAMDRANANAKKTMEATGHTIGRASAAEWYHNALENPQKTAAAMLDRAGNALSGSMRLSFMDDFQRVFDDATVAAITNEMQQKNDNIYEYTQTVNKNIQELNKMAADTESSLAAGAADYIAQLINIHPDLVKGGKDSIGKFVDTKALDKIKTGTSTESAAKAIKVPEYLKYSGFYDKNKGNLITPNYLTQVRPANARDNARKLNTTSRGNIASAANPEYMQALTTPYGQRNH